MTVRTRSKVMNNISFMWYHFTFYCMTWRHFFVFVWDGYMCYNFLSPVVNQPVIQFLGHKIIWKLNQSDDFLSLEIPVKGIGLEIVFGEGTTSAEPFFSLFSFSTLFIRWIDDLLFLMERIPPKYDSWFHFLDQNRFF